MTRLLTPFLVALSSLASAAPSPAEIDKQVDIEEHLGDRLPLQVPITLASGETKRLGELLHGRPMILALVYYRCDVLCSQLLGGLTKSLRGLDWLAGREYDVLTLSVDPSDPPELVREKRRGFLQLLGQPLAEKSSDGGWYFSTAPQDTIDRVSDAVGFRYLSIEGQRQFAHVAALFVITPDGRVARYLYGIEFDPRQLKLALFEAAGGRVGTTLERVLLRCYRWDPAARKYHDFVTTYFRVGGLIVLLLVAGMLGVLWRRELIRARAEAAGGRS